MSDSLNPEIAGAAAADPSVGEATLRKVTLRLIPFLFVLYVINMLDRTNVGIASLQMLGHLGMSEEAFGIGTGLFFWGYFIFEIPSNLILARTGARVWIARILISWGLVSSAMMFVKGPWSFYALRIGLGLTEAGFFPGIILYLSQWFPAQARARAVANFMAASAITSIVGNPLSGAIMKYMDRIAGLAGWQWVFLLEGLPAVIMGFATLRYLTDRPEHADWLTPTERNWLVQRLAAERAELGGEHKHTLRAAFTNPVVWLLTAVYFTVAMGDNTLAVYLPKFLNFHLKNWNEVEIGLLAAVPSMVGLVAMILYGMHSDRTGERRWHVAAAATAAAAGWVWAAFASTPWVFVLAIALTAAGMKCMLPTFWTLPMSMLKGTAAAGGIALINSVGNLGGSLGSTVMGHVKKAHGEFTLGMGLIAVGFCAGAVLVLFARDHTTSDESASAEQEAHR